MEQKYTAKQWALIEGGHCIDESPKFGFIGDLNESRMYRTRKQLETSDLGDVADFAFLNLLSMHILNNDEETQSLARAYAKRTVENNQFKNYKQSGTDLYQALHKLTNNSQVKLPEEELKTYLRQVAKGKPTPQARGMFMKLERALKIQETNYKSLRRLGVDWAKLTHNQRRLVNTRLLQYYRTNAIRSELYAPLLDYSKANNYILIGANNAEKASVVKKIAARTAMAAAGAAAGFAMGREFGRSLVRGKPVDR
jgi:hypothetical protein